MLYISLSLYFYFMAFVSDVAAIVHCMSLSMVYCLDICIFNFMSDVSHRSHVLTISGFISSKHHNPSIKYLQCVDDYVRCCTWQLKKTKPIYRFHRFLFDRGDSTLWCFNRATQNYWASQSVPDRYRMRENESCLCWFLQGGIMTLCT
jgi:hypothetical protein